MTPRGKEPGARLSIGALSRATGIPVETLRTWEARYGFPVPERKPSGHRVYPLGSVPRLRRIGEALARGHRAGQVVPASEQALSELLAEGGSPGPAPSAGLPAAGLELPQLLALVERFEAERLVRALFADWARLGPLDFLDQRVGPLVKAVGEAWETGRFDVAHEHFLSEKLSDLLRSLRLPFEERAGGPLVVLATLPEEPHALGLQMAALVIAHAGCRLLYLGPQVPPEEMVALARDLNARALALSLSVATQGRRSAAQVRALRERLPRRTALLVGGEGAPGPVAGVERVGDFGALDAWARRIATGAAPTAR